MTTRIAFSFSLALACLAGGTAHAATCALTVRGERIIDDATCSAVTGRGIVRVLVQGGDTVTVRRSAMSGRIAALAPSGGRPRAVVSLGSVVVSDPSDDRTCYFGQKAVLCVAR